MTQHGYVDEIVPVDRIEIGDDGDTPGISQPLSQAEIEEMLYSDERPSGERLMWLRDYRDQLSAREAADFGGDDPGFLIAEIDRAIERLSVGTDADTAPDPLAGEMTDRDPHDHRETLAPDSDELADIEDEDLESLNEALDEPLDEVEWVDGDGFRPERGVH